jgi:DNA-binding MarR family transcriptional regulator
MSSSRILTPEIGIRVFLRLKAKLAFNDLYTSGVASILHCLNISEHKIKSAGKNVSLSQFGDRLGVLLPALMRELWQYERSFFARGEINVPQLQVLNYLHQQDSCTMRQLARTLGLRESTTTGQVDRMVAMGLIKRQRDALDRRVVRAAVTAKGRSALKEHRRQQRRGLMALFKRISASERSRWLDIIEKLVCEMSSDKLKD